jgi:hypothetical protein
MMQQETKGRAERSAALSADGDRAGFGGLAEGRDEGRPGKIRRPAARRTNGWGKASGMEEADPPTVRHDTRLNLSNRKLAAPG